MHSDASFKPIQISNEGLEMIEYLSLDCDNSEGEGYSFSEKKPDRNSFVILNDEKNKIILGRLYQIREKPLV